MYPEQQQYPTAQPGSEMPSPPPRRSTNGLSIAGFILAFLVAPIGFILSIVGLVQGRRRAQKGRGLAIAGIAISVVAMVVAGTATALIVNTVGRNITTIADPGCTSGKDAILGTPQTPTAGDLQKVVTGLDAAAAKSRHDNVRNAMEAVASDYTQAIQAVDAGGSPSAQLQTKLDSDLKQVDALCTVGGNGK